MDEFGDCIAETLQRQHDEKNAKALEALESVSPKDFFTLVQGLNTAGERMPRFKKISLVPTEPADEVVNHPVRAGWSRRRSTPSSTARRTS